MTPESSTKKRLDEAFRRISQLEKQLAKRDDQIIQRSLMRLARTFDDGSYPAAPATVYPIVFIDAAFTHTAGAQDLTVTDHLDDTQALAYSLCGEYLLPDTLIVVLEQKGPVRRNFIVKHCGSNLGSLAIAKLTTDMCSEGCVEVECVLGTEESIGQVCNPTGRRGRVGQMVIIGKFKRTEDESEQCEDCDCAGNGDFWAVIAVEPECRELVADLRITEGNSQSQHLVACKTNVWVEVCTDDACGVVVGELEPVTDPQGSEGVNSNCSDVVGCADAAACCGLCSGGKILVAEVTASTCPSIPVGTKVDMLPDGVGWLSTDCLLEACFNGLELSCSGDGDPDETFRLDATSQGCTSTAPCPDPTTMPAGGYIPSSATCDPFELVFPIELNDPADPLHIGFCDCCDDPAPAAITITITEKDPD